VKRPGNVLLVSFLVSGALAAQEPRPQGPPHGQADRGPDRNFFLAQTLRAIDQKAGILIDQGRHEAAADELRKVLAIDIPKDTPMFEAKVHLIGRLAISLTNIGKKKEAVETIQKLLAEVPKDSVAEAQALLDAGTVYRQSGMPDEALKMFDRAIDLSQKLAAKAPRGPADGGPPARGFHPGQPPSGGRPGPNAGPRPGGPPPQQSAPPKGDEP